MNNNLIIIDRNWDDRYGSHFTRRVFFGTEGEKSTKRFFVQCKKNSRKLIVYSGDFNSKGIPEPKYTIRSYEKEVRLYHEPRVDWGKC